MAVDRRRKDMNWAVADPQGDVYSEARDGVMLAVLMDIRDELKRLNELLHCQNFIGIPGTLRAIHRKIPARRRRSR